MRRLVLMMLLVATFHGVASGQETTGTITGVASDASGAVLPGVTVTVKNLDTSTSRTFVTNETGSYTAAQLAVGAYEVTFELSGFESVTLQEDRFTRQRSLEVGRPLEGRRRCRNGGGHGRTVSRSTDPRTANDDDVDAGEGTAAQ